jgi:glycosyltransferase involved in cell wall biosynthesis
MKFPLVSIIIPTYNRASLLIAISVNSVLKQKYQNWELIIVDDGSTDNTKELILKLIEDNPDKNIRYYYQGNKGQGAARNLGIKKSNGNYILCLDSDDYLLPEMIEIILNNFDEKNYFVSCKNWVYQKDRRIININAPNPSSIIFKKSTFYKMGFFDESHTIRGVEDRNLMIAWQTYCNKKNIEFSYKQLNQPMIIYLKHEYQETDIHNLGFLNDGMKAIAMKCQTNKNAPKNTIAKLFWEAGNLYILSNNLKKGQKHIKESLKIKFNRKAVILLLLSYLGTNFYKIILINFKYTKEEITDQLKLYINILKYPVLYKQAKKYAEYINNSLFKNN